MTKEKLYEELKTVQKILWQDDDRMEQGTLFFLQDMMANLMVDLAVDVGKVDDLKNTFPFLYKRESEG